MSVDAVDEPSDPRPRNDERTMLMEFLDFHRTVLLRKASGLTPDQLDVSMAPSTLTIGALVRHMTFVEDHWFGMVFAGEAAREPWASADWDADRDWEMTSASGMTFDDLRTEFEEACDRSRSHVDSASSLDDVARDADVADPPSLRWILIHMIEEYARHCGHADLLRESIDGRVGD